MTFNFLKKRQKPEYFLTLDIGTETVKTLIFKRENNKKIILGQAIEYFEDPLLYREFDFQEEILQKIILKVIEEVQNITKIKTKNLFLGLPANILRGRIIWQNFNRKNPKESVNETEENQIYQEIFAKVKFKLSQEFAQKTGLLPHDFHFSNLKILEMRIDGYDVSSIKKMVGTTLDFKILAVFLAKYQLEKIKRICQNLNLKILRIAHLAENLHSLFFEEKSDVIFLDIGGQLTSTFLLEKGKLTGISEFEKGGINFTQKISQVLGLSFSEARSLKHDFSQSILSEGTRQKIEKIFSSDIQNWFGALKENLGKFPHKLLPSNIFLSGGGSLLPGISGILEKGDWSNFAFILKPKTKFVYPKNLKNIESKTKILNNPQDIPLFLISHAQ